MEDITKIWEEVKEELQKTVAASTFEPWIAPLEPVGYENDIFSVLTGHSLAVTLIRKNCYSQIIEALKKVLNKDNIEFNIIFDEKLAKKIKKEHDKIRKIAEKPERERAMENLAKMQSSANLNLKYKFENFVVGSNSEFAQAAAMAVAKSPADKYNPLFIYGDSGLGKTHLMQAIGHYILFNNKNNLKVKYLKTEQFTNELIDNIRAGKDTNERMSKFRQKYRNVDVLLIDDVQFVEGKKRTAEELFHTFDYLHNKNKQIVITSDRPPKDIPTLPERLRTRFEWGLTVDITPPDFETRVAILTNLAESINMPVSNEILECVAKHFNKNVRELEGAFNKISAYASMKNVELDLETVKRILKIDANKKEITLQIISDTVAKYYGVTLEDLKSSARNKKISNARKIAVFLIREILQTGYTEIAEFLNKKHTTMIYSYDTVKEEIQKNSDLNAQIKLLKNQILDEE